MKSYCDWNSCKNCVCGEEIDTTCVYINMPSNKLETSATLSNVIVPKIFEFDNLFTCEENKDLIKNNTFNPNVDYRIASLMINNIVLAETKETVNQQNYKGNTSGHTLILYDEYHRLYAYLEKLYELGLDIFIKNNEGFCLAHIFDIHRHFVKWFCEKNKIDPFDQTYKPDVYDVDVYNKEFMIRLAR